MSASHSHHQGLAQDVAEMIQRQISRRRMLWLGLSGTALLVGCGENSTSTSTSSSSSASSSSGGSSSGSNSTTDSCSKIPEETAGPYPGDGSNGQNVLTRTGVVRSDIRPSLSTSTVAQGIPLTVQLKLVNINNSCAALTGYAIYLWHCDREGNYSMYSSAVSNEDYLRGVQSTDDTGMVVFQTIFPACYSGRWPHIHFEIYPTLNSAMIYSNKVATSQLALPEAVCDDVYATTGYSQSVRNLAQLSLSSDNIFSDGYSLQMASVTGNTTDGYVASLVVGVSV
jgi:protocatechuate 3,4-dioxygenase beta subunit